jgi:MoaA/NifB/PqqE/SkfB family radical SAM enzyme
VTARDADLAVATISPRNNLRPHEFEFPMTRLLPRRRSAGLAARIAKTLARPTIHPFVAFLNVTRRCNLACGYCREYDHESDPVPLPMLQARVAHLARLGTAVVTLNGGEPLTHPEIARVIAEVRARGMAATMNTNAFLLTRRHIDAFNRARLSAMQVSVDGLEPNETTYKSLRSAAPKLALLARHARFAVHVNAVLGAGATDDELDRLEHEVDKLGLRMKIALLRAADGSVSDDERTRQSAFARAARRGLVDRLLVPAEQVALARGEVLEWKCRAGARYLHVCDRGLVHPCGAKLGTGSIPLEEYTMLDVEAAFRTAKRCAARCGVAYAHSLSRFDAHRSQDLDADPEPRTHLPVVR